MTCRLVQSGWNPWAREQLEQLIRRGAGQGLPVVFDFDNTLVCGDIGEAVLAVLARSGKLPPHRIPKTLTPVFRTPGGRNIRADDCADITEYYLAYLDPTAHGPTDPTPLANGYVFATEVMQGLSVAEVVEATRTAYRRSRPGKVQWIEVTPGKTSFPAPFFYPEMIELIAVLLRNQFDLWIVSASNVWSVRWMILHALNVHLQKLGLACGIRSDHVIGISTLLRDARGCLYKDAVLVRENSQYASLRRSRLNGLKLTSQLQFPVPAYSGKVACILDAIGRVPYLAVGDSPADHPMLLHSQNRLWIARMEKPESQRATQALMQKNGSERWIWQPTFTRDKPGFSSNHEHIGC